MHVDKKLVTQLARTANLSSTIHGGMSQSRMNVLLKEDECVISLRLPGVEVDSIELEIADGYLCIYQTMHVHSNDSIGTPLLLSMLPIISNIDVDSISASFSDGYTSIILPFNGPERGNERQIDIVKK